MKTLTLDESVATIERLVQENPDRINPVNRRTGSCLYQVEGDPTNRCIAGEAFSVLGITVPGPQASVHAGEILMHDEDVNAPWEVRRFFQYVQTVADGADIFGLGEERDDVGFIVPRPWSAVREVLPQIIERANEKELR